MNTKKNKTFSSQHLFIALVIFSILVVVDMVFLNMIELVGAFIFIPWILLSLAGIGLIITTYKEKISGKQKLFLLSAGFSSAGFLLFVVLHNLFYAIGTVTEDLIVLHKIINILAVTFFITVVIICPIVLLTGIIGTLIIRKKLQTQKKI